jgi:hypothetical protein
MSDWRIIAEQVKVEADNQKLKETTPTTPAAHYQAALLAVEESPFHSSTVPPPVSGSKRVMAWLHQLTCFTRRVHLSSALVSTPTFKTERTGRSKTRRFSFVLLVVVVGVLGYAAFRRMWGLMMLGDVDSAIGRVRVVSAAENQFAKEHPEVGYTCTLSQLPRREEITRLLAQNQIDNGYAFEITGCQTASPEKPAVYYVTARPLHDGPPSFCSDQSGVLMSDEGGSVERCIEKRTPFP